jgi:hypothetical protein
MKSKSPQSKKPKKTAKPKSSPRAPAPTGPTLIPPTTGSCSTCFYGQLKTSDMGRLCRVDRPVRMSDTSQRAAWPVVADDDWCGDGEDMTTYGAFAPDWY